MNLSCLICNLNLKVITITELIYIFDNNNQIFQYLYLHKGLVPWQSDNINRMITLTVITISGGHYTCFSISLLYIRLIQTIQCTSIIMCGNKVIGLPLSTPSPTQRIFILLCWDSNSDRPNQTIFELTLQTARLQLPDQK